MKKFEDLDIIIPVSIGELSADAETIAESIKAQYNDYGFTRFALAMPGKGWRLTGYPPQEYFHDKAKLFLDIKKLLPSGISCGWWHCLVLKSGPTPGYTRIVRLDGSEAPFSTCPLDPAYRKRFAEDVAFFLAKAHPDFFLTEDDFGINCHGGPACFCKHHLEEFARREGRFYSREELEELFTQQPVESRELLRRWQALAKDSLSLFASAIREEADKLTPEIPMGIAQPGCSQRDGDSIETVARAIAGKNHVPFVRFCGTFYAGEHIDMIPEVLFRSIYYREHIKGDFRFYHESDTYPHSRFYTSGSCMRAMMSAIYSCGYDGSLFQSQPPAEECAYGNMYKKERCRLNVLRKNVADCKLKGVQVYHDPFEYSNFRGNVAEWLKTLSSFGIPYTSADAPITFFSGEQMRFMNDEEIKKYLTKTIVLDGTAAKCLTERGYSEYMGAAAAEPLIHGNDRFDLGAKELIGEDFLKGYKNRAMRRGDTYSPGGNGEIYKLVMTDPACREVTAIVNTNKVYMAPGMTLFKNKLDGNVIIYASEVFKNQSSSLFCYTRQALLQELLARCGADFPMVQKAPKVYLIVNEPEKEKDFSVFLTIINLAVDPLEELTLFLPEKLKNCQNFSYLDRNGEWQKMNVVLHGDTVTLQHDFNYTDPVFVKVR